MEITYNDCPDRDHDEMVGSFGICDTCGRSEFRKPENHNAPVWDDVWGLVYE